jgi:hypothetical protein
MNGNVVNNAVMRNRGGNFTLTVNGDFANNGTVRTNPTGYSFNIRHSEDIINNGNWTNNQIELIGTEQHISCGNGNVFEIGTFFGNNTSRGNIYFDSDVGFVSTNIDLQSDNIVFQSDVTLSLSDGYLYNGTLSGDSATLNMTNDNCLYSLTISVTDLTLSGTCQIANDNVIINSNVINNGIMQNRGGTFTLTVNGDFTNNGTVRTNPYGYGFYIYLSDDIVNNGTWTNSASYANGTADQTITIDVAHEITGSFGFISDIATSPYQWRFNNANLDDTDFTGETSSQLNWSVPVASGWFGTFDCVTGAGTSRDIIVVESGTAPDAPLNLTITINGNNVELRWDEVTEASSYTVYSDTDPYGSFGTIEYTGAINEWSEAISGNKKFYRVTASN